MTTSPLPGMNQTDPPNAHPTDGSTSLLIRGGRVIDPESGRDETADVLIAGGRIRAIGRIGEAQLAGAEVSGVQVSGVEVIDAEGLLVTPGLIDPHVHLRDPGQTAKEDIATGTAAAAAGGFTTVCCMPNTQPAIDTPETVELIHARARDRGRCRVFCVACGTAGRAGAELAEIRACVKAGAVGISDDGDVIADAGMMLAVLRECADLGVVFMQHAQDPTLTRGSVMHEGAVSARLGLVGWPRIAEEIIVERDIRLARSAAARYHVQHISSGGTVDLIRRARAEGLPVSGEASPHHLLLTDEACDGFNTLAKMNPPLREASDVRTLVEGVADGTITVLATDHAPHTLDEKARPFDEAPFGIVGIETALPLYAEALVQSNAIGWPRLIELLTLEPARLCGLDASGLGTLREGGPADLTLIAPDLAWTCEPEAFLSKGRNTPFAGRALKGRALCTIVGGGVTHRAEALAAR
ncbi:MAG: dihydroorotase [Planctomycetota bacterium]